jgi:Protein of unknown function (DUF2842)
MRLRILWGTIILLLGLGLYALAVMVVAVDFLPAQWAVELVFYFVTGTLWLYPAARLTKWMQDLPEPPDRFAS